MNTPPVKSRADSKLVAQLRGWASRVKRDGATLWLACRHRDTPWLGRCLGLFVIAYAFSPIDLIPDFIPVLGYVDDLLLLPVLIWLTIKLIPKHVLAECRQSADEWIRTMDARPYSRLGVAIVLLSWLGIAMCAWWFFMA